MDYGRLKEVLTAFADDPTTLYFEKGEVVVQIQQEVISARLRIDGGVLLVEEDGVAQTADKWVTVRIAQLDQFAHGLSQMIQPNETFITSSAKLLDQIGSSAADHPIEVHETLETLRGLLDRRPAGMCSVDYLTSDAGEGKTTLINQLALSQASAFRKRETNWLLVPITLGGNPFLRLDNVIAAGLLNQLRSRRFFYDAFIELVRLGLVVLALDGFEEVFVETAGDAVSSLGNLIRDMKGEGTILVAARTAYFDFRRLDQQARLYDSIPGYEVGFARLSLDRWGEKQFLAICDARQLPNGSDVYRQLRVVLPADHPLLTRAVFVRRIIDLAKDDALTFLQATTNLNDFFHPFIDNIIEREIKYKWIDNSSGVSMSLLSLVEHHELLELLAEEMLLSKRTVLPTSACQDYADIFCEAHKKSPAVSRQVRERITNHALLATDATRTQIGFDHDHFREFFLGELVGSYLMAEFEPDLRKVLRIEPLAPFTLDTAISTCVTRRASPGKLIHCIQQVASSEGSASFVRENAGALILRVIGRYESYSGALIHDLNFPNDALARPIKDVEFRSCYFQTTSMSRGLEHVSFQDCEFEYIELKQGVRLNDVQLRECRIRALGYIKDEGDVREFYDPRDINSLLMTHGIDMGQPQDLRPEAEIIDEDPELVQMRKLLTLFGRSTVVSDHVLNIKFGSGFSEFENSVLPALLGCGVLVEIPNRGGGSQRRYKLGRPVSQIGQVLVTAKGSFVRFVQIIDKQIKS